MAVINTNDGKLYIRKGDTGQVQFTGFRTDKTYTAYLSVYDEEKNKILAETSGVTVVNGEAIIYFTKNFSDSLPVGEWVYAVKTCSTVDILGTQEDTVIPRSYVDDAGNIVNEDPPTFTVDYKLTEGEE